VTVKKVLVANRGEIAVRIIRACKELGIASVQAYSTADKDSLAVRLADEAVCIGSPSAQESYLNTAAILNAAEMKGVDALHPGYGFLSEDPDFAQACLDSGLVYIGPQPEVIRLMGNKAAARALAEKAGVPVIPGSNGPVSDLKRAAEIAEQAGYPVLVKAAAGGGGRGMRIVEEPGQLETALQRASAEAQAAFGSGDVYIEKYLPSIRHIEVQVFGDGQRVLHFGERDCTIQRRHQKLLEEAPSPVIKPNVRKDLYDAALSLCQAVNYRSAGTIEFVFDVETQKFYFIEMNTRIQVEHTVTEMLTGHDLVKMQIRLARGEALTLQQEDVSFVGHVIQCRINAENPEKGFFPSPGTIEDFAPPLGPGVRVDTHAYPGYKLPPFYDSLVAKVLAHGMTRDEAISRMQRALEELSVTGITTTAQFHQRLLAEPAFLKSQFNTQFVKATMWAGHPAQHLL
jgi:acetyl-CoA carboxylase biotin carboxylase subunit